MSEQKKYYWLKLKEDFFDDDTIEWIEEQPGGEKYSLFYLKLCLKSLKTNGVLIRNVGEILVPYDVKKLAEMTKTDVDTARVAMEVLKNIGLIQILENGEIYLTQLKNMVGSETSKAQLMRDKRAKERQKQLEANQDQVGNNVTKGLPQYYQNVPKALPNCYPEIEKEIELDIEKELEKELEKDKEIDKDKDIYIYTNKLTKRESEIVELLKDLFVGWSINDYQILFLYSLMNQKLKHGLTETERDIKIYDNLDTLTKQARADEVQYVYRWLVKVIPEVDCERLSNGF